MLWLISLNKMYKTLKKLFELLMLNKHKLERWFYKIDWSILIDAHGGTCAIIHTQGCTYIPEMSTNITHFTKHTNKVI